MCQMYVYKLHVKHLELFKCFIKVGYYYTIVIIIIITLCTCAGTLQTPEVDLMVEGCW